MCSIKYYFSETKIKNRTRNMFTCGKCPGCFKTENCGKCKFCLDKPMFGGNNLFKQKCVHRICRTSKWMRRLYVTGM